MTTLLQLVLYMTVLTFVAIMLGAILRNREWTAEGLKAGLSNRDQLPEPTALGRASPTCLSILPASPTCALPSGVLAWPGSP